MANNDINEVDVLELEPDTTETRVYELSFHIDAELPQEEAKKVYQVIKDAASKNGEFVAEGEPEKIPLAYTISRMDTTGRRDFNSAYFGWVAFEANGEGHEAVVSTVKGNPAIIRFLDVRTTVDAAKHAAEMHEFYRKATAEAAAAAQEESAEDEPAADADLDAALKEAGVE